jgi:predicted nucleic acid-binding protein
VCRQYGLTPYDALYIELAQRTHWPLATLDQSQLAAAHALNIACL